MPVLAIRIVRYVDDNFPGWVESVFCDKDGNQHVIVDKVPMLTTELLGPTSSYPTSGELPCHVLEVWKDAHGRELARITTPGLESTEGLSTFEVLLGDVR